MTRRLSGICTLSSSLVDSPLKGSRGRVPVDAMLGIDMMIWKVKRGYHEFLMVITIEMSSHGQVVLSKMQSLESNVTLGTYVTLIYEIIGQGW